MTCLFVFVCSSQVYFLVPQDVQTEGDETITPFLPHLLRFYKYSLAGM